MKQKLQSRRDLQGMLLDYDDELRRAKRKQVVDFQYVRHLAQERNDIAERLRRRSA